MATTTEVGKKLEWDFAEFMKDELGYSEVEHRIPVTGKVSERYYDCDIHGIEGGGIYSFLRKAGIVCIVLAVVSFLFEVPEIEQFMEDIMTSIDPSLAGSGLIILGVGGFMLGQYGKNNMTSHTWVECKELKTKVMRDHIVKLKEAVADVNKLEDAKWKVDTTMLVSKSGFDADTINFAREYEIELYQRKGDSFELVE